MSEGVKRNSQAEHRLQQRESIVRTGKTLDTERGFTGGLNRFAPLTGPNLTTTLSSTSTPPRMTSVFRGWRWPPFSTCLS